MSHDVSDSATSHLALPWLTQFTLQALRNHRTPLLMHAVHVLGTIQLDKLARLTRHDAPRSRALHLLDLVHAVHLWRTTRPTRDLG